MKKIHFTSLIACAALALFGAAGHAHATASESSPISAVSTQASAIVIGSATAIQIADKQGVKVAVKANALKQLYDTLSNRYYDQSGVLLAQDEYGYGTHDCSMLKRSKPFHNRLK
ncbi:hypothetical protein R6I31_003806 [Vibrio cholerae]|uniref:hypothetical protein n=1 Tax=Vibrio cholerae TaxID=666 RepID=UPI0006E6BCED|nr:hypothetical protein [Vibrio cholerae]ELS9243726.1 hypothetical protein [Vibrio cholerae]ELS9247001.1 hypothetical protein [Vibrio cholerae]KQA40386.1 hypothetical protein XV74_04715 [Vibrio cholerae]KQA45098.1 hypothetical protein XV75_10905 [Vibrio cholerae]KQA57258.1 hypothetical protein XV79_08610 [Vibrio cholerae]